MKTIHDVIREKRKFIGREKELHAMIQLLSTEREWHVLHFYGPAGIGKTVLLQYFEQIHEHVPVIYVDGHQGMASIEQFVTHLYKQLEHKHLLTDTHLGTDVIETLTCIAKRYDVLVLLLDGLDRYSEIRSWLKDDFLKHLPVNVRVCTAGRLPLTDWQSDFGWETIVHNMQIKPFSKAEWMQYAQACGITDDRLLYQIGIISQGIPLAVSLTCHRILQKRSSQLLNESDYRYLLEMFDHYLLSEEYLSGINITLLSLASLTYTFDQEMLEYMLEQPIDPDEFTLLCQSSFVQAHVNGGWMIKHGIRRWARARLKERFPSTYEKYKKRAEEIVERRITHGIYNEKAWKLELAIRKFLLQENEYVQSVVYWNAERSLTSRAAKEEEIPILAEMYQKNIQISPPHLIDDSYQEQYLYDIYKVEPSSVQVFAYEDQILGFYVLVPMHNKIISIFDKNPMTQTWVQTTRFSDHDRFFWLLSSYPALDWEVIDFFLHHVFLPILYEKKITCLVWNQDQTTFLKLLGFEHLDFADYRTPSGLQYSFYCLDPKRATLGEAKTVPSKVEQEGDEWAVWQDLTKKLLSAYTQLQWQHELLRDCKQLWGTDLALDKIALRVQKIIEDQYQWLQNGTKQERTQAQILKYAFLKRRNSHEAVAALLNLPTSTYYRQLKKLIHSIAYILCSQKT